MNDINASPIVAFSTTQTNTQIPHHGKPTISLIIPCFNEQDNIQFSYDTIVNFWYQSGLFRDYHYELVYIDDGSSDATLSHIEHLEKRDSRVICVELARNFGKEIAVSAGYAHCSGDAAIIVDVDLQYPINKLPDFISQWEQGYDVVIGVRDKKKTSNIIEILGSRLFYRIMDHISETKILSGALDFRLIDRQVIDAYNSFTERGRTARVLIDWLGYRRTYIPYTELERQFGTPAYNFTKRLQLALNSFISHSFFPMKAVGYIGLSIMAISLPTGIILALNSYAFNDILNWNISGSFNLAVFNLFLTGVTLASLGLIANYIATIQNEVINRPLYVVRQKRAKRHKQYHLS